MARPTIELYPDIHCPWTYPAVHRLCPVWPEYVGRVRLVWRILSLECITRPGDAETHPGCGARVDRAGRARAVIAAVVAARLGWPVAC